MTDKMCPKSYIQYSKRFLPAFKNFCLGRQLVPTKISRRVRVSDTVRTSVQPFPCGSLRSCERARDPARCAGSSRRRPSSAEIPGWCRGLERLPLIASALPQDPRAYREPAPGVTHRAQTPTRPVPAPEEWDRNAPLTPR
ncbi:hypothetical protein NDU88_000940 [Pleurodeles waltl]|uniref:Uncharacterized protein n=1 Tax=Pleurodeles waltl TaxID=8319 RepID=A0AAV7SB37_PLEWA|nr:hypothetical protein NDU88_000940 [Pleurodeles waltl]